MMNQIAENTPDKELLMRKAILSWNPSIDLKNTVILPGGSNSTAVRAGETVYRFPQTKEAFAAMRQEANLTKVLRDSLSETFRSKIAEVFIVDQSKDILSAFSYHRYIPGKIMDNRRGETEFNTCYAHLNLERQDRLARETAAFLAELHSVPLKAFQKISLKAGQDWDFTNRINIECCRELLLKHSHNRIDLNDFKMNCSRDFVFCHNDLSGSNILIDPEKESILTGIIDFANAGFYPRTNEFVPLYKIGRDFVCRIVKYYNRFSNVSVDMRETDYKLLCFICFLLEKQKKPSFFITALIKDFIQSYFTQRT